MILNFSQYLVGWLKTVAMLDPVKLSELAKASTDGWAPSPTTASLGSWYDRGTQREVNTNIGHSTLKTNLLFYQIIWLQQLHDCPSYANSKNVVLVKHFVGG